MSHCTGFPLELVSIVPHFGTSSLWTRKTATLVKENSLSVGHRPWTHHSLYQSIHLLLHPSIHPPIHPSSISSPTYPSFRSGIHSMPASQNPTLIHACLHPSTHPCIHWEFSRMKSWGSRESPVQFGSVLSSLAHPTPGRKALFSHGVTSLLCSKSQGRNHHHHHLPGAPGVPYLLKLFVGGTWVA